MTPRQRFIAALERQPFAGRVPHFELVFFLTMEAFGKLHPSQRVFHQWEQMSERERQLHRLDQAKLYIQTAERYEHSAIFLYPHQEPSVDNLDEIRRMIDLVRELSGDRYFLMLHGDGTLGVPSGADMEALSVRMIEEPKGVAAESDARVNRFLEIAGKLARHGGLDGFALCSDYCFNTGPFLSPAWFDRFVTPFLQKQIKGYRDLGYYAIKHTDGNIMPIIDRLVEANPHAIHSLDPQGGMDMAEVKRRYGQQVCLIGNVNCGLMDTGTDAEVIESARYALKHGMPGGGYIFSTSNCIYTGMRLDRYELILDVWRREGNYPELHSEAAGAVPLAC
jgi:uroporphyrinogen decarboxylase